jgi:ATP phosphoribosyltransferase regulatory subunit
VAAAGRLLGRGGRYDGLLASYGRPAPGAGFALDLEALQQVLQGSAALPADSTADGWLVVPESEGAAVHALRAAERLRGEAPRVEMELTGRTAEDAVEYARRRGIGRILWVGEDGSQCTEEL